MIRSLIFGLISTLFLSLRLVAQDAPIIWGEIPMEQLKMTSYPADSNASAVVLCSYGNAEFDDRLELNFTLHQRIKILSEQGYKEGTVLVPFHAQYEQVRGIAGATYTLDAGGKVAKNELAGNDIFEENIDNEFKRIRFTLPRLAAGAVIEFRYTKISRSPQIPTWYFQGSNPVLWSEFRVHKPEIFVYENIMRGYLPITNSESIPFKTIVYSTGRGGSVTFRGSATRYIMKNVPALREEPFMTTVKDYISKLSLDLRAVKMPERFPENNRVSWEQLVAQHLSSKNFGKHLDGHGALREKARELATGSRDTAETVKRIAEFVRATIRTDEYRIYAYRNLDDVYRAKTGNCAEVNLILTLMLREVGVSAAPVLLSTRSNGRALTFYPSLGQFNYIITRAMVGGKELLLDVSSTTRPIDLLAVDALGGEGLVIEDSDDAQWISLAPKKKYKTSVSVSLSLSADGSAQGEVECSSLDYGASATRSQLKDKKEDEVIKAVFDADANVKIDSAQAKNKDSLAAPMILNAAIRLPQAAMSAGEMLYLNPMIAQRTAKNPFTLKKRYFPVDMPYPQERTTVTNLRLPDGYVVVDSLKNVSMRLPDNSISYQRQVVIEEGLLQSLTKLEMKKLQYLPEEYDALREFFDRIVALEAEQVVLQKKAATPAEPSKPTPMSATKKKK